MGVKEAKQQRLTNFIFIAESLPEGFRQPESQNRHLEGSNDLAVPEVHPDAAQR